MSDSTKTLTILKEFLELPFTKPTNVLEFLNANAVSIDQSCGGFGICTTCRFFIRKGNQSFSPRTETEQERSEERGFSENERLACQTEIFESAEIEIPT